MINLYDANNSIMHEVLEGTGRRLTATFDLLVRGDQQVAVNFLLQAIRSKVEDLCQGHIDSWGWGPGSDSLTPTTAAALTSALAAATASTNAS